ncbi:MAG: DUF192 domain-containing protein [Candidatus Dojkabacteria bacterium]
MNNQIKLLIYIAVIAGIFFFLQDKLKFLDINVIDKFKESAFNLTNNDQKKEEEKKELLNYVEISKKSGEKVKINVEVADTELLRRSGLSNRRYLGDYDGMLFLFDEMVNTSFWMKDMYLPLDIVFLDSEGFIVDIKEGNEPCSATYCPPISSSKMYKYVLEVNVNFCEINGIAVGNSMIMHLDSSI